MGANVGCQVTTVTFSAGPLQCRKTRKSYATEPRRGRAARRPTSHFTAANDSRGSDRRVPARYASNMSSQRVRCFLSLITTAVLRPRPSIKYSTPGIDAAGLVFIGSVIVGFPCGIKSCICTCAFRSPDIPRMNPSNNHPLEPACNDSM